MEDRKSVLETTTPADALERLSARRKLPNGVLVLLAVIALFALVFLVSALFRNTFKGSERITIPSVAH